MCLFCLLPYNGVVPVPRRIPSVAYQVRTEAILKFSYRERQYRSQLGQKFVLFVYITLVAMLVVGRGFQPGTMKTPLSVLEQFRQVKRAWA